MARVSRYDECRPDVRVDLGGQPLDNRCVFVLRKVMPPTVSSLASNSSWVMADSTRRRTAVRPAAVPSRCRSATVASMAGRVRRRAT